MDNLRLYSGQSSSTRESQDDPEPPQLAPVNEGDQISAVNSALSVPDNVDSRQNPPPIDTEVNLASPPAEIGDANLRSFNAPEDQSIEDASGTEHPPADLNDDLVEAAGTSQEAPGAGAVASGNNISGPAFNANAGGNRETHEDASDGTRQRWNNPSQQPHNAVPPIFHQRNLGVEPPMNLEVHELQPLAAADMPVEPNPLENNITTAAPANNAFGHYFFQSTTNYERNTINEFQTGDGFFTARIDVTGFQNVSIFVQNDDRAFQFRMQHSIQNPAENIHHSASGIIIFPAPIQFNTFEYWFDGNDIVFRARPFQI